MIAKRAYRFLHSVKDQQKQKLPSAVQSVVNLSIKIVRVADQAGRHNITVTGVRRNEYTVAQFRLVLFFSCGALLSKRQVEDIDKSLEIINGTFVLTRQSESHSMGY
jgi:hypothetical protein